MGLEALYCQYPCCIGQQRYVIIIVAFVTLIVSYCQRVSFNIGMVEMVDHKETISVCPAQEEEIIIRNISGGKVSWTETEQGYNLGSFYIGYAISHMPFGLLCDMYGAKYPLIAGMFLSSTATSMVPLCALKPDDWWIALILRICTGIGQGAVYPALASLITRWISPLEISVVGAFVFASNSVGVCLGNVLSGLWLYLLEDWIEFFILWGGVGYLLTIILGVYIYSDPRIHPRINASELNYLKEVKLMKTDKPLPIRLIFTDKCVLGLIIMQLGHDLIVLTLSNNLPKYIHGVLGVSIKNNALVSIMFMLQWISGLNLGMLADFLIRRRNFSVSSVRTLLTTISHLGALIFFCFAVLSACDKIQALVFFGFAIFFQGFFYAGGKINIMEISINHAGFVMGAVNGIAAIVGFIISLIIGYFSGDNTFAHWQIIMGVIGFCEILSLILYMFLSNARRRIWDYAENELLPDTEPLRKKWFQELSDSDHQLRLAKNKEIKNTKKQEEKEARAQIRDSYRRRPPP